MDNACRNRNCRNTACRNSACRNSACRNRNLYPEKSSLEIAILGNSCTLHDVFRRFSIVPGITNRDSSSLLDESIRIYSFC